MKPRECTIIIKRILNLSSPKMSQYFNDYNDCTSKLTFLICILENQKWKHEIGITQKSVWERPNKLFLSKINIILLGNVIVGHGGFSSSQMRKGGHKISLFKKLRDWLYLIATNNLTIVRIRSHRSFVHCLVANYQNTITIKAYDFLHIFAVQSKLHSNHYSLR